MSAELQWVLHATANVKRGVAKPLAVPAVLSPGFPPACLSLDEVLAWAAGGDAPIVRGKPLDDALLAPLGIVGERYRDGTRLAGSTPLNADEVLRSYSAKMPGPWKTVYTGASDWLAMGSPEEIAASHLAFLRRWGLSGGIVGRWGGFSREIASLLADWIADSADMRMLVVADRAVAPEVAEDLRTPYLYLGKPREASPSDETSGGCFVCTPQAIVLHEAMAAYKWDVIVYIELDALYPSTASKAYRVVSSIRGGQRIGLLSKPLHALRSREQRAATALLRLSKVRDWPFLVRDARPCQRPTMQPQRGNAYRDMLQRTYAESTTAYLRREGIPFLSATSPYATASAPTFERFLQRCKGLPVARVAPVPFDDRFPGVPEAAYQSIAAYYAWWRHRYREGVAEDADDGYPLLYAIELLHDAEARERSRTEEAWNELYDIAARLRAPLSAEQVLLWALDYANLNLGEDAVWDAYDRARDIAPDAVWLDAYLHAHRTVRFAALSDKQIERLACGDANRMWNPDSPDRYALPHVRRALDALDAAYLATYGAPTLAAFRPEGALRVTARAYENCPVYPRRPIKLDMLPYTHHAPLIEFLRDVKAYAEDAHQRSESARKRKPAKTKLEAFARDAIEEAFGLKPKAPQPRVVRVDLARALALERESTLVREALIVSMGEEGSGGMAQEGRRDAGDAGDARESRDASNLYDAIDACDAHDAVNIDISVDTSGAIANEEDVDREKGKSVRMSNQAFHGHDTTENIDVSTNAFDMSSDGIASFADEPIMDSRDTIKDDRDIARMDPQIRDLFAALSPSARTCLSALANGPDGAFEATARAIGGMPATLFDEINEAAQDAIGDLLLEEDERGRARILDEYRAWFHRDH